MRTRVIFRIAAAAFLLIALASAGLAQTTGGIVGRVTDENGGGLPGVTVQVESPVLQGARVTTTDPDGHFRLNLLPPGDYTLTFQLAGFGPEQQKTPVGLDRDKEARRRPGHKGQSKAGLGVAGARPSG